MLLKSFCTFLIPVSFATASLGQTGFVKNSTIEKNGNTNSNFFQNQTIDTNKLYKLEQRSLKAFEIPLVRIKVNKTQPGVAPKNFNLNQLPTSFDPIVKIGIERKQPIAYIYSPQYIRTSNGNIEALISSELEFQEVTTTSNKTAGTRVYANNSVLASGNWYKIALSKQGIYKITGSFIKTNLGVDLTSISPSNIRLYGNGGTMLSEDNNVPRADDLVENAIKVVDGGDGQFNENDYILFYANGPHAVVKDSITKSFRHTFNLYSDQSAYFLNFDLGTGKRIEIANTPNAGNINVNTFNEFQFYEKDSTNVGRFGKTWWGSQFNDGLGAFLNRTFSFDIPNIVTDVPVNIITRTGTGSSSSGYSNMIVRANGQNTQSIQYEPFGGGAYWTIPSIISKVNSSNVNITSSPLNLDFTYTKGSSGALGYIDFIQINARRKLVFNGYLNFADWNSVAAGNVATYTIENANTNTEVWDITNPLSAQKMNVNLIGSNLTFTQEASRLHRFVALDGTNINTPNVIGKIPNQNLHNYSPIDYLIVVHPTLKSEAERLANHHSSKRGYKTKIVTPGEIYNEFSSGTQDISAIRDYIKMLYDKASINEIPKNVLLFGDASYDFKDRLANNTNLVPVYETNESEDRIDGYCTDDFFGYLDDVEDINKIGDVINTLDIGIGRIPVSILSKAAGVVNKIILYDSPQSFGPWKNNITFNADDGDSGSHIQSSEALATISIDSIPNFNIFKVYVDGFVQESTPAGSRSPDANKTILSQLYNGTFLMNYNGHGGPTSWCDERIFNINDINGLTNKTKLPLFITATCDFAPFDNPTIESAGELLINKPDGGAIALMTTTQLVFAYQNAIMNGDYMRLGFRRMPSGQYPTLGEAYRISKNMTYVKFVSQYDPTNFRKFALLGDPGLPLSFPKHQVFTDSVNGVSVTIKKDTLKAQSKYTISGHIADINGNKLSGFSGTVYPTIFDKPKKLTTLQNGTDNPKIEYSLQNSAIYKGKATVKNGQFNFTFVVPKDIDYQIGNGKISYYADNSIEDANGHDNTIFVGGSNIGGNSDNAGPVIKAFMNNEKFVNGGITNPNSILLLKLFDDNGINYTGNSVGHDITAILDDNTQNTYVLNNFFEADLDDYQRGVVRFPVSGLSEGKHTFTIKAWDVFNNSSEVKLDFVVVNSSEGQLTHVYNYPNPFSTKTQFMFEHNRPNQNLFVSIDVFSISGKVVKSIRTSVNTPGTRVDGIEWDGKDAFGDKLGKGVYFYKLGVKADDGFSESKLQKLVLLQ